MTLEVFKIKQELEKDPIFCSIKEIEKFAEKIDKTYWSKNDLVILEIRKASLWLMANPARKKKNHARFLCNWFNRCRSLR